MNILSKTKYFLLINFAILFGFLAFVPAVSHAQTPTHQIQCGINAAAGQTKNGCNAPDKKDTATSLNNLIAKIVNLLSSALGVVAIIMIIVAGFRYVTSGGNEEAVKSAKRTILYAIIGLVVAFFARLIVHFVLGSAGNAS